MTIEVYTKQSVDELLAQQSEAIGLLQTDIEALQNRRWLIKTSNYQAQVGDRIVANGNSAGFTITLPIAATSGDEIYILTLGTNTIIIDPAGGELNGVNLPIQIAGDRQETHLIYMGSGAWVATGVTGSTGNGENPPPQVIGAAGVEYGITHSKVYGNGINTGTYSKLNDGNGSTGAACDSGAQWLKATFPSPVLVSSVTVGGGYLPDFGEVAFALNNAKLQFSTNDADWVDITTVSGVSDSGASQFKKITLPTPIEAKYWRLQNSYYLATTEFRFE